MQYEGVIYRPPSEAHSLLIQVTVGCSWNKCTFCEMYKGKQFRLRPMEEIKADLQGYSRYRVRRIFLCDGDAMMLPTDSLLEILTEIQALYPDIERVRTYASARDILSKSVQELSSLAQAGLDMVYLGLESGSDDILAQVNKGITKQQMIDAAHLLKAAKIKQSITIIAGLGGSEQMEKHAAETADALNHMQPEYLGMLVLHMGEERLMRRGRGAASNVVVPSDKEVIAEMQMLLERLELDDCFFSSAHISNYIDIRGRLPLEKEKMLGILKQAQQSF